MLEGSPHEPSAGSSIEEDEETNGSISPFDCPPKMDLQVHEKSERRKASNNGKKSSSKIPKSNEDSPTLTKIAKEV